MLMKVFATKKVWFDLPVNEFVAIPENLRKEWLDKSGNISTKSLKLNIIFQ